MEILGKAQAVAPDLQGADGFLKGLLIGFAEAHDFAHGLHLGAQFVFGAGNFSKAQRANFTTTYSPQGSYFSRVPRRQ
jgi:hypothetical protein